MSVKVVLFDAAGVLFPMNLVVGESLERTLGLSSAQMLPMWQELYPKLSTGELTTDEFFDQFARMYNLPRSEAGEWLFIEPFLADLSPMPGIGDLLQALYESGHGSGLRLAMLSDTTPMFAQARERLGFSQYFDKQFLSYEIGFKKPDPRAYQLVIDYYGLAPAEIFFVDDLPANIDAARQSGMQSALFEGAHKLSESLKTAGVDLR